MLNNASERKESSAWSAPVYRWIDSARRLFSSADKAHWSNSLGAWLALNALDTLVTGLCLSRGMREANLFPHLAIETYGTGFMIAAKMGLALLVGILIWKLGPLHLRASLNVGMSLILIVNCILVGGPLWSLNLVA